MLATSHLLGTNVPWIYLRRLTGRRFGGLSFLYALSLVCGFAWQPAIAEDFHVAPGNVAGLASAIIQANQNVACPHRIILPPGKWTLNEPWTGTNAVPRTGLPFILHDPRGGNFCDPWLEIVGSGMGLTTIERATKDPKLCIESPENAPRFRILAIGYNGGQGVKLSNLTLQCGNVFPTPNARDGDLGGAILSNDHLILDRIAVINNGAFHGGGIWAWTLTMTNSLLKENVAAASGGAVFVEAILIRVDSSVITNNTAGALDVPQVVQLGGGGGILSRGVVFAMSNSSIADNRVLHNARQGGGLDIRINQRGDFSGLDIRGNSADGDGGGIYLRSGANKLKLSNSTLSSNFAKGRGSAIAGEFPSIEFLNVTIVNHEAPAGSEAINIASNDFSMLNSIIAATRVRAGASGVASNCGGSTVISSGGHNLDSDGSCKFGAVGDVSIFNPATVLDLVARNNGGSTFTHALVPGGFAVDHGARGCSEFDQRGALRPQDGNGDGIAVCDIGAFELRPTTLTLAPTADAYIRTDFDIRRNDNYGMQDFIRIGTGRGGDNKPFGAADAMRSLVQFALPTSPALKLTGAVLETTLQGFDNGLLSSLYTIDAHAIRGGWLEGNGFEGSPPLGASATRACPLGSSATITDPDNACGVAWAGVGDNSDRFAGNNTTQPPFEPAVLASQEISQARNRSGDVFQWDLVTAANRWLNGTLANNGIMLTDVTSDGSFRSVRLGSREGKLFNIPNAVNGPALKLSWTVGTKPGDLTGDTCVDNSDMAIVLAVVRKQAIAGTGLKVDVNGDGRVDIADARKLVTLFSKPGGAPCN